GVRGAGKRPAGPFAVEAAGRQRAAYRVDHVFTAAHTLQPPGDRGQRGADERGAGKPAGGLVAVGGVVVLLVAHVYREHRNAVGGHLVGHLPAGVVEARLRLRRLLLALPVRQGGKRDRRGYRYRTGEAASAGGLHVYRFAVPGDGRGRGENLNVRACAVVAGE